MATEAEVIPSKRLQVSPKAAIAAAVVLLVVVVGLLLARMLKTEPAAAPVVKGTGSQTRTGPPAGLALPGPSEPNPAGPPPGAGPDPFNPLFQAPVAPAAPAAAAPAPAGPAVPAGPGVPAAPAAPAPPVAAAAPAPPPAPGPQTISLLDSYFDQGGAVRANIKVGETPHNVGIGDVFAQVYKLEAVRDGCATLSRGPDRFTVCKGRDVVK